MAVNSFGNIDYTVPGSGMTLLSTTNLSGVTTTISSINQTYTNLLIVIQNPYNNAATQLRINPNGSGSACAMGYISNTTGGTASNIVTITNIPTATGSASYSCLISNYADTTYTKPVSFYGSASSAVASAIVQAGIYTSSSAVTSIDINNLNGTSTFSGGRVLIYGVK